MHAVPQSFQTRALVLLVAAPLSDVRREQHEVQEAMVIGIPIALLIAAAGGLYLASVGLRPITDALRTQRQFMADASHELRTPVSIVRAYGRRGAQPRASRRSGVSRSARHRRRPGAAARPAG